MVHKVGDQMAGDRKEDKDMYVVGTLALISVILSLGHEH